MKIDTNKLEFSCDTKLVFKDCEIAARMSEKYFQTTNDSEQLPITENSVWFRKNFPESLNIIKNGKEVVGVTFLFLSDQTHMKLFLNKKISENELTEYFKKNYKTKKFNQVYLSGAFIKTRYRGSNIAVISLVKQLEKLKKTVKYNTLFYWAYSPEGRAVAQKVAKRMHMKIYSRKD